MAWNTEEHVLEVGYTNEDDGIWLNCRKRGCNWRAQVEGNEFFPSPEELLALAQEHYAEVGRSVCGKPYRDRNGDPDTCSFPMNHEGSCW